MINQTYIYLCDTNTMHKSLFLLRWYGLFLLFFFSWIWLFSHARMADSSGDFYSFFSYVAHGVNENKYGYASIKLLSSCNGKLHRCNMGVPAPLILLLCIIINNEWIRITKRKFYWNLILISRISYRCMHYFMVAWWCFTAHSGWWNVSSVALDIYTKHGP